MTLAKLEATLDEALNKKAPIKLPPNGSKTLAEMLWVVALVLGVLQLLAAYWLWDAGHRIDTIADYANRISSYYGGAPVATEGLGLFYYLSLITMAGVGVMLLIASPALKVMKKDGWNLLFYAVLVEVVAAIFLLFTRYGGFGDFLWAALSALLGAYLLFQVRDHFAGKKTLEHKTAVHHESKPVDDKE